MFDLFDKLCLLSDGNVVYFGDAQRTVDMFTAAGLPVPAMRNPADHFLHCINRDFAVSWLLWPRQTCLSMLVAQRK